MNNEYNFTAVDFDPFESGEIEKTAFSIEPQKEIWAACIIGGEDANRAYNESISLLLTGTLKLEAMQMALQDVVTRHEALRSTISTDGNYLCINKPYQVPVLIEDLSNQSAIAQQQHLDHFNKKDAETAFDLQNGPLFRTAILKLSDQTNILRLTAHHIICDGWSLGILLEELGILYSAYVQGSSPILKKAIQFSEYATELQAFYEGTTYRETEQYWLNEYQGVIPVLNLPTDFERPARRTYKSRRDDFNINSDLVEAIKQVGKNAGSSLVSTLMTAFEIYLQGITGQNDIVIGLPSAGQAAVGHHALVGHCVNLLPLRSKPDGDLSFLDYLKSRRTKIMDDYEHQQFTFGTLIKKLNIARDNSRIPLVPFVFNVDMGMDDGVSFYGLKHQLTSNPRAYENFEISLNITGSSESMTLEWSYNTGLFKQETITQMMDGFEGLLTEITREPNTKIKTLSVNHHSLIRKLDNWNDNSFAYDKDKTVHEIISETANRFPDRVAVSFQDVKISYGILEEKSNRFANYLIDNGVKIGDKVGIALDRSADMIVVLIATMKTGAVYLPFDTNHPKDRIVYMLEDAEASFLIASQMYASHLPPQIKELQLGDAMAELDSFSPILTVRNISAKDLIYILYTSGSTGKPKGAQIRHGNVVNFLLGMQQKPGIMIDDKLLAITPISFDMAVLLYLPLICGAELVVADLESSKDGRLIYDIIVNKQISWMIATPSTWKMIIDSGWKMKLQLLAISAGESLSKDLAGNLLERCTSVWNGYGPTETTVMVLMKEVTDINEPITLGKPIINTQIYILDQYGDRVPIGVEGEIYIAGDNVGVGYRNLPDLTSKHFVTNLLAVEAGSKMYRTGDLGKFMSNGDIQYLGRIDHQVKIRGHRIELGEIEQTLIGHKDIKSAVVNPVGSSPENLLLVAYIIPEGKENDIDMVSTHEWDKYLKNILPDYMLPYEYIFVESFPLTENGKIDRKRLPLPGKTDKEHIGQNYKAPKNPTEEMLSGIWKTALSLTQISTTSDFFEIGGHSLIAVQIMVAIEQQTNRRLPLSTLFENPTIEKLAKMITIDEDEISWDSLVKIKPDGSKTPIYMIHGGGLNVLTFNTLGKYMDEDQPVYAMQALGLNGESPLYYTMEEIAAKYIEEVLHNNPDGPYALAGYSLGGLIAYEMARQLKADGKEIIFLGILDTNIAGHILPKNTLNKVLLKIIRQFKKLFFFSNQFLKRPKNTVNYQIKTLTYKIKKIFATKYKAEEEYFTYEKEINRSYEIAFFNYKIKPLDVAVDLFRVQERLYFLDDPVYLGWNKYAKKGVKIHQIPGDHKTFLFAPNDKAFADILQKVLDSKT